MRMKDTISHELHGVPRSRNLLKSHRRRLWILNSRRPLIAFAFRWLKISSNHPKMTKIPDQDEIIRLVELNTRLRLTKIFTIGLNYRIESLRWCLLFHFSAACSAVFAVFSLLFDLLASLFFLFSYLYTLCDDKINLLNLYFLKKFMKMSGNFKKYSKKYFLQELSNAIKISNFILVFLHFL